MAKRTDSKGRILRSGEGQRAEDGRYTYRYTDIFGKRHTVYATSLPDLRDKEKEIQRDLEDGIDISGGEMTLNQLFDFYMGTKKDIRPGTKRDYYSLWRNNVESSSIGNMKIKDIKTAHIRVLYSRFAEQGHCEGTTKRIHSLLNETLEFAVESDMIRKNPCRGCGKYISGGKNDRRAMSREEEAELLDYLKSRDIYKVYYPLISFLLNTGLRASELSGLRWSDVDLKNDMIHIRQQLVYRNFGDGCKFHLQDLKTENAERDIPLSQDAKKALMDQRQLDMAFGIQRKEIEGISDFVFVNTQGKPLMVVGINNILDRAVKSHNERMNEDGIELPHISAHILRHTFATRAAEAGMDAKTLQMILGHSDVTLTMNVYVQLDENEIQRKFHEAEDAMKVG